MSEKKQIYWKMPISAIVLIAYGVVSICSDGHFGPGHIGPATVSLTIPTSSGTSTMNSAVIISPTSDFEYEATRPSLPLKGYCLTAPTSTTRST
jgi:hypothetical protein